ncbi:hypothetical protein H4S14_003621 [Agrobacterium vitis]|nr:hypothetical protein [Agrobacterium vitis]MBE1439853.1 hypothetical protein [Agrobacterium vitis]
MSTEQSRFDIILAALIAEYSAEGCPISTVEGVTYAHITDDETEVGTAFLAEINLTKVADQIDRRIK